LEWQQVEGRWFDQDRDQHLELTPDRLVVEVIRAPMQVNVYHGDLQNGTVALTPLVASWPGEEAPNRPRQQSWKLDLDGNIMGLQTAARVWSLKKAESVTIGHPRAELTGLWRQVKQGSSEIQYFEFTPWATLVTITYEAGGAGAQAKSGPLLPLAQWWEYSSPEPGVLALDGVTLETENAKTRAKYSLDANTLTLDLLGQTYTLRKTDSVEITL
jgi:hypothetical protein